MTHATLNPNFAPKAKSENSQEPPSFRQEILDAILRASSPMKVALFGSRARGDHRRDSDYDLLVVFADDADLKAETAKLRQALSELNASVQILPKRWSDYLALQGVTVGLWGNIRQDAKTLYERSPQPISPVQMKTNQDLAKTLFEKAQNDLERAKTLFVVRPNDMEGIGFNAQQAIEKALKAVLAQLDIRFPRTHDLNELLKLLAANGVAFDDALYESAKLNDFAVELRYDEVVFELDAPSAIRLAEQAIAFAETFLNR